MASGLTSDHPRTPSGFGAQAGDWIEIAVAVTGWLLNTGSRFLSLASFWWGQLGEVAAG